MTDDKLQALRQAGLKIDDPGFISEYSGGETGRTGYIQYGRDLFTVDAAQGTQYLGNADDPNFDYTKEISDNTYVYDPSTQAGLEPFLGRMNPNGWQTEQAFRFIESTTPGSQEAEAGNFGKGTTPTADQYTGKTMGQTSGGTPLYELQDGSTTATPPPTGAATGGGDAPGYGTQTIPAEQGNVNIAGTGSPSGGVGPDDQTLTAKFLGDDNIGATQFTGNRATIEAEATRQGINPANLYYGDETVSGAGVPLAGTVTGGKPGEQPGGEADQLMQQIAAANPDAIANPEFVNALYQAGFGRDATRQELDQFANRSVKDASNIILGQDRSPFADGSTTPLTDEQRTGQEELPGGEGDVSISDTHKDILAESGIKSLEEGENPVTNYSDNLKGLYEEMGLPTIKAEFDRIQAQFDALQVELNDEVQDINDNPWLTEGVRLRRIASMEKRFEGRLSILTNSMKLTNSLYEQGREDVKFLAGLAQDEYQFDVNTQIKLAQLALDQSDAEAALAELDTSLTTGAGGERLLVNNQTGEVIANLGQSTKYSSSSKNNGVDDIELPKLSTEDNRILASYNLQGFSFSNASQEFKLAFTQILNKTQRDAWLSQYNEDQAAANSTLDPERHLEDWLNEQDVNTGGGLNFSDF